MHFPSDLFLFGMTENGLFIFMSKDIYNFINMHEVLPYLKLNFPSKWLIDYLSFAVVNSNAIVLFIWILWFIIRSEPLSQWICTRQNNLCKSHAEGLVSVVIVSPPFGAPLCSKWFFVLSVPCRVYDGNREKKQIFIVGRCFYANSVMLTISWFLFSSSKSYTSKKKWTRQKKNIYLFFLC